MRRKIVKYGENYLQVDVPDYANGETFGECVVVEPAYEKLKEPKKLTFIDKIVNYFDNLVLLTAYEKLKEPKMTQIH